MITRYARLGLMRGWRTDAVRVAHCVPGGMQLVHDDLGPGQPDSGGDGQRDRDDGANRDERRLSGQSLLLEAS